MWTTNFYKSFFENIFLYMNGWRSKIRFRTVSFGRTCITMSCIVKLLYGRGALKGLNVFSMNEWWCQTSSAKHFFDSEFSHHLLEISFGICEHTVMPHHLWDSAEICCYAFKYLLQRCIYIVKVLLYFRKPFMFCLESVSKETEYKKSPFKYVAKNRSKNTDFIFIENEHLKWTVSFTVD